MNLELLQKGLAQYASVYTLYPLQVTLVLLMLLDFISGITAAIGTKTLSSNMSFRGVAKKAAAWVLVALAQVIEPILGGSVPFTTLVLLGFIATEGLSVLENLGRVGILPPFALRDALAQLNTQVAASVPPGNKATLTVGPDAEVLPGGQRRGDPPIP